MLLIYGANGFTGQLIVEECVRRGLRPIVAGRNATAVRALAAHHQLEARVAPLSRRLSPDLPRLAPPDTPPPPPSDELLAILDGVHVVLHCAGPFFRTSGPMVQACLDVGGLTTSTSPVKSPSSRRAGCSTRRRGSVVSSSSPAWASMWSPPTASPPASPRSSPAPPCSSWPSRAVAVSAGAPSKPCSWAAETAPSGRMAAS
ncbi:MAG: saccharopine dehydrogenase NADP-binding domain-containing protein [Gemmatimonas sp.]|nr:saccharopine dehydrogenase NADP-binding domain-containing protein [Gemmatimonas sp.]